MVKLCNLTMPFPSTQNLAYTLALVGSVVVPEPWSLALLSSGWPPSRSSDGVGRGGRLSSEGADSN